MKGTGQKLLQQRIGPFLILEKINPAVYCLHLPTKLWMCPVANIEHLTQCNQNEVNQQTKLKDLQMLRGEVKEYLIQWKEYGLEHDTLGPESHLTNAFMRLRHYKK